jgi:hypothetical protein
MTIHIAAPVVEGYPSFTLESYFEHFGLMSKLFDFNEEFRAKYKHLAGSPLVYESDYVYITGYDGELDDLDKLYRHIYEGRRLNDRGLDNSRSVGIALVSSGRINEIASRKASGASEIVQRMTLLRSPKILVTASGHETMTEKARRLVHESRLHGEKLWERALTMRPEKAKLAAASYRVEETAK